MTDRPIDTPWIDVSCNRAVGHSEGIKDVGLQTFGEWLFAHGLQDIAGEVDAEVGIAITLADREAQPGSGEALDMSLEIWKRRIVVVADRCLVGKTGPMTQEQPQGHLPRRQGFEAALHAEVRQVGSDGLIEMQQSALHGEHDGGRGEVFGRGLDAEDRSLAHRTPGLPVRDTKTFDPGWLAIVDEAYGDSGNTPLGQSLSDVGALSVD